MLSLTLSLFQVYQYLRVYTEIAEVNLFKFVCRLFHEDFSPIYGVQSSPLSTLPRMIPEQIGIYAYIYMLLNHLQFSEC